MPKGVFVHRPIPVATRLLRKTICVIETRCWEWNGWRDRKGYGYIQVGTLREPKQQVVPRAGYEALVGPIPSGKHVLHSCDNPACWSPEHLFIGTPADNMADKKAKGRAPRGEEIRSARLNETQVREIRRRHDADPLMNLTRAAEHYGVSITTIWLVVHRRTWRHIS